MSVYYPRLLRDGRNLKDDLSAGITDQCDIFEKPLGNGWFLRKYAHAQVGSPPGKGCYSLSFLSALWQADLVASHYTASSLTSA